MFENFAEENDVKTLIGVRKLVVLDVEVIVRVYWFSVNMTILVE